MLRKLFPGLHIYKLKVEPYFKWFDLWIGLYIVRKQPIVYIGILPMAGVRLELVERGPACEICGVETHKVAYDTGEGWALWWDCDKWHNDGENPIDWPFEDNAMTGDELEKYGYEIG